MTRPTLAFALLIAAGVVPPVTAQPTELPLLNPPPVPAEAGERGRESAFPLLPEGAYLADRLVRLEPIGTQASAVVFLRSGREGLIRPMALQPCASTQAMEQLAAGAPDTRFEVSGQVFVSRGINYFLPLIFRVVSPPVIGEEPVEIVTDPAPELLAEREAPPPLLGEPPDDIAVDDLLRELEAATVAATSRAAELEAETRPVALQREGGVITLRRGRLVRGASGAWVFTFDSGATQPAEATDAPLGLMPCALVDEMEAIAARRGDHVTMTVSGRVFLYGQENYLLPTMFFVNRSGEGGLTSAH